MPLTGQGVFVRTLILEIPEKLIKKFSPVTEATYYILLALIEPLHGYGVMKKVEQMINGRIIIAAGTLYDAFSSLEKNKLIKHFGVEYTVPAIYRIRLKNRHFRFSRKTVSTCHE